MTFHGKYLLCAPVLLSLTACNGSNNNSGGAEQLVISGIVSQAQGEVTINEHHSGESLTTRLGEFTLRHSFHYGSPYYLTAQSNIETESCHITPSSGHIHAPLQVEVTCKDSAEPVAAPHINMIYRSGENEITLVFDGIEGEISNITYEVYGILEGQDNKTLLKRVTGLQNPQITIDDVPFDVGYTYSVSAIRYGVVVDGNPIDYELPPAVMLRDDISTEHELGDFLSEYEVEYSTEDQQLVIRPKPSHLPLTDWETVKDRLVDAVVIPSKNKVEQNSVAVIRTYGVIAESGSEIIFEASAKPFEYLVQDGVVDYPIRFSSQDFLNGPDSFFDPSFTITPEWHYNLLFRTRLDITNRELNDRTALTLAGENRLNFDIQGSVEYELDGGEISRQLIAPIQRTFIVPVWLPDSTHYVHVPVNVEIGANSTITSTPFDGRIGFEQRVETTSNIDIDYRYGNGELLGQFEVSGNGQFTPAKLHIEGGATQSYEVLPYFNIAVPESIELNAQTGPQTEYQFFSRYYAEVDGGQGGISIDQLDIEVGPRCIARAGLVFWENASSEEDYCSEISWRIHQQPDLGVDGDTTVNVGESFELALTLNDSEYYDYDLNTVRWEGDEFHFDVNNTDPRHVIVTPQVEGLHNIYASVNARNGLTRKYFPLEIRVGEGYCPSTARIIQDMDFEQGELEIEHSVNGCIATLTQPTHQVWRIVYEQSQMKFAQRWHSSTQLHLSENYDWSIDPESGKRVTYRSVYQEWNSDGKKLNDYLYVPIWRNGQVFAVAEGPYLRVHSFFETDETETGTLQSFDDVRLYQPTSYNVGEKRIERQFHYAQHPSNKNIYHYLDDANLCTDYHLGHYLVSDQPTGSESHSYRTTSNEWHQTGYKEYGYYPRQGAMSSTCHEMTVIKSRDTFNLPEKWLYNVNAPLLDRYGYLFDKIMKNVDAFWYSNGALSIYSTKFIHDESQVVIHPKGYLETEPQRMLRFFEDAENNEVVAHFRKLHALKFYSDYPNYEVTQVGDSYHFYLSRYRKFEEYNNDIGLYGYSEIVYPFDAVEPNSVYETSHHREFYWEHNWMDYPYALEFNDIEGYTSASFTMVSHDGEMVKNGPETQYRLGEWGECSLIDWKLGQLHGDYYIEQGCHGAEYDELRHYVNGQLHGFRYKENTDTLLHEHYDHGILDGPWLSDTKRGTFDRRRFTGGYLNGNLHGWVLEERGKPLQTVSHCRYDNGVIVECK